VIFPEHPGIYAVYNTTMEIQYIGISRKISSSVKLHKYEMPRYCGFLRFAAIPRATKADLQLLWKQWMQEHLAVSGGLLPPGNVRGNSQWSRRKHLPPKINILLTNGVNSQVNDSTVFQLCREIVESYNIVAFIKGTRWGQISVKCLLPFV
jgi:hypothetical protein